MFNKILYPTDFSETAKKALGYVKKLKDAGTNEVVLVNVVDERSPIYGLNVEFSMLEKLKEESKNNLEKLRKELEERGFKVAVISVVGVPFVEINRIAEEEDVSLVVMGSHGKSMIKEMLLGSTSEKVARKCIKPVLIVKK